MWSPITATASSSLTISTTPGTAFALASFTPSSLPPITGHAATVAIFMPGTWMSIPNTAVPLTLDGVSSRRGLVPISLNWDASFNATLGGTGSSAARLANAP